VARAHFEFGGSYFRKTGTVFGLGRANDNAVSVSDDVVSRYHAEVECVGGRWTITDLDSQNGTFLNRRRIDTADLRIGDTIVLGEGGPKVLVVVLDPPPVNEDVTDDLQATRLMRVKPRGRPVKRTAPPSPPPPRAPVAAVPVKTSGPFPWFGLVGIAFGVSVALAWWSDAFPYEIVAAPCLRITLVLTEWLPDVFMPRLGLVLVAALGVYWGTVAACMQRLRTLPWLILIGGAHVMAVLSL